MSESSPSAGAQALSGHRPAACAQVPGTAADSDAELMARTAAGDRAAFGDLVDRHKDSLVAYLARLAGSVERAEDLAQEAFLRLFRAADRYREEGQLTAYLYRIATNLLRSEQRRTRRWRLLTPKLAPADGHRAEARAYRRVLQQELSRHLAEAVAELPMRYRVPLVLFEIEGWSQGRIAELLGCREGTVKSRIFRARERLRRRLAPHWNGGLNDPA